MENYFKLQRVNLYFKKSINTKLKEETFRHKLSVANELYIALNRQISENKESLPEDNLIAIQTNCDRWYEEIVIGNAQK